MFVTRKHYEETIGILREQYEARIASLNDQIKDLRSMVFVPTSSTLPTPEARELDAVISVSERPVNLDETAERELREQNLILSGEYEYIEDMAN